ncbi:MULTISPECIES: hypothetical protein [Paenibacillus]|uniref:DUF2892 domain-containing protein n=1 Tax=Paenibacillus borealis TaxID=160799 RepID=A0ABX3H2N4_PAEBO|nr:MULTISPECIES: hypothetical protein [Paenibacillus]AIQ15727.1 hypothetical protein H70357_02710 [Paenibacillus sp. FSL H7-0357]OMD44661.1 hypothetical protein BSK56_22555 [Paenibacillus borealis]
MKKNNQIPAILAASILLILLSSMLKPEGSTLLGVLQTLMLGVGLLGCCTAAWRFAKGGKGKS